ncbi:zinc ribbon domain-containing protein, partial [Kibdelosporangium lantanae]
MNCPECGRPAAPGSKLCTYCGYPLLLDKPEVVEQQPQKVTHKPAEQENPSYTGQYPQRQASPRPQYQQQQYQPRQYAQPQPQQQPPQQVMRGPQQQRLVHTDTPQPTLLDGHRAFGEQAVLDVQGTIPPGQLEPPVDDGVQDDRQDHAQDQHDHGRDDDRERQRLVDVPVEQRLYRAGFPQLDADRAAELGEPADDDDDGDEPDDGQGRVPQPPPVEPRQPPLTHGLLFHRPGPAEQQLPQVLGLHSGHGFELELVIRVGDVPTGADGDNGQPEHPVEHVRGHVHGPYPVPGQRPPA